MTDAEHEAFAQGVEDADRGRNQADNPFASGSMESDQWLAGWRAEFELFIAWDPEDDMDLCEDMAVYDEWADEILGDL